MKKRILATAIMCCALVLAMGLVACGGSSSSSAASSASGSATSASSQAASSASTSASASSSAASSSAASSSSSSQLDGVYDSKAREMESAKNDFINTLNNDAKSFPEEMGEAHNNVINDDLESMTKNINEIYDSGVEWLEEAGGSSADVQAYKDKLAQLRDSCLAELEQTANDLKV